MTDRVTQDGLHVTPYVNGIPVDPTPIFNDDQCLQVYFYHLDMHDEEVHVRVDLRWVSLADAAAAIRATPLHYLTTTTVSDPDAEHPTDILVTRDAQSGLIVFCVLYTGGRELTFAEGNLPL